MTDTAITLGYTFAYDMLPGTPGSFQSARHAAADLRAPRTGDVVGVPRVGEYVIDYAPLAPDDLVDPEVDAELEAMLAASTVVHRNEGV